MLSLLFAAALAAPPVPAVVTVDLQAIEAILQVKPVIRSTWCGQDNAWYSPRTNTITMCAELYDRPNLARFILHHELGHAFFATHGLYTGDDGADEEFLADELGAMVSSDVDIIAGAQWFMDRAVKYGNGADGTDPHPPRMERAAMLVCLLDGLEDEPVEMQCGVYARSALAHWNMVLASLP